MPRFLIIIILLGFLSGCASRPKVTDMILSRYPVGTSFDKMEAELKLKDCSFEMTPNLPNGKIQGWYRLPEGDLMVSYTCSDGRAILDSQPYILDKDK
jgi:hypothetical protein